MSELNREEEIFQALKLQSEQNLRKLAKLLAGKEQHQLLGETEFQVRDIALEMGSQAMQAAAKVQKKGATEELA